MGKEGELDNASFSRDPVLQAIATAPVDDEPLSNDDRAALQEAREAIRKGDVVAEECLGHSRSGDQGHLSVDSWDEYEMNLFSVDSIRMVSPTCTVCGKKGVGQTPGQFLCFYQAVLGDRKEMICPDCQARLIFMAVDMLREKLQQEHDCPSCHSKGYVDGPDLPMVCNRCIVYGMRR